ncbi:MAG: hypothetical protein SF002_11100 [Alphaproteobacteria bacterium]|nr:hypothetical protein [Alphaproteobacteria bacterium]
MISTAHIAYGRYETALEVLKPWRSDETYGETGDFLSTLCLVFSGKIEEAATLVGEIQTQTTRHDLTLFVLSQCWNFSDLEIGDRFWNAIQHHVRDRSQGVELSQLWVLFAAFCGHLSQQDLAVLGREYGRQVRDFCGARPTEPQVPVHAEPNPARPLRVGILWQYFNSIVNVQCLSHLSKDDIVFFGYSQRLPDKYHDTAGTDWLLSLRGLRGLTSLERAQAIKNDQLDLLITFDNPGVLGDDSVLYFRPAKRIASFSNMFFTSGEIGIDSYIFAESVFGDANPEEFSERIIRTPFPLKIFESLHGHCLDPLEEPSDRLVIGSIASEFKLTDKWFQVIREILDAMPEVRFAIDCSKYSPFIEGRVKRAMYKAGIQPDRVTMSMSVSTTTFRDRLAKYTLVVDTQPFTGNLTSLQALSAGVPVVTSRGETIAGRHTVAILDAIGESSLIAPSFNAQIDLAIHLLRSPDVRAELRRRLPVLVRQSPIGDPKVIAEAFKAAIFEAVSE